MEKRKQGRPPTGENFIKKQISFPEKMYEDLEVLSKKKGINNINALVRIACTEYMEREVSK